MARVTNNTFTKGISGKIGKDMLFKNINGVTHLFKKPKNPTKQSKQQKDNRLKFKMASFFAKSILLDPEKKAEYWEIAKRLNLPNAYTAALTEYMRNPEIKEVDMSGYNGEEGDEIKITAVKKSFEVEAVEVAIFDRKGKEIEVGNAEKRNRWGDWVYRVKGRYGKEVKFVVRVRDRVGNWRVDRKVEL